MRTRRFAVAAASLTIAALALSGCVPQQNQVVDGSVISVGWGQSFTSYNASTSYGNKPGNVAIASTALSGFNYVDDVPQLVTDPSFGSYELLSEDPLVVRFTIADGVTWSDGTAIDAADLLLEWAALSGVFNEKDFDALLASCAPDIHHRFGGGGAGSRCRSNPCRSIRGWFSPWS